MATSLSFETTTNHTSILEYSQPEFNATPTCESSYTVPSSSRSNLNQKIDFERSSSSVQGASQTSTSATSMISANKTSIESHTSSH